MLKLLNFICSRAPRTRCTALALFALCVCAGCQQVVLSDLDQQQSNAVLAALEQAGIAATRQGLGAGGGRYSVSVSRGQRLTAWRVLKQHDLPRRRLKGLGEVFAEPGLLPSRLRQDALLRHALANELTRTLRGVDGVVDARVHLVPSRRKGVLSASGEQTPARASVLLRVSKACVLTSAQVAKLVAGGVDQLSSDAVSVVMVPATGLPDPTATHRPTLVKAGPFAVAPMSQAPLLASLAAAVMVVLAALLGVALMVRRTRRQAAALADLRRELDRFKTEHADRAVDLESSMGMLSRSFDRQEGRGRR